MANDLLARKNVGKDSIYLHMLIKNSQYARKTLHFFEKREDFIIFRKYLTFL